MPLSAHARGNLRRLEDALGTSQTSGSRFHAHRLKGGGLLAGATAEADLVVAIETHGFHALADPALLSRLRDAIQPRPIGRILAAASRC
jgi:hypothetical protein